MKGKKFAFIGLLLIITSGFLGSVRSGAQGGNIDWKSLSDRLVEQFKPKIVSVEKLDQKSCWVVLLPETSVDAALDMVKMIGEYIKANIPPETNPKPMVRAFVGGKQVAVAILDGQSYRAVKKQEDMDPAMFKGQYRPK